MSKIKEMIQERVNELAILEKQKEEEAMRQPELVTTTVRVSKDTLYMIDLIGEKLELRRSDLVREFLEISAREGLQQLQVDPVDWYPVEDASAGGEGDE